MSLWEYLPGYLRWTARRSGFRRGHLGVAIMMVAGLFVMLARSRQGCCLRQLPCSTLLSPVVLTVFHSWHNGKEQSHIQLVLYQKITRCPSLREELGLRLCLGKCFDLLDSSYYTIAKDHELYIANQVQTIDFSNCYDPAKVLKPYCSLPREHYIVKSVCAVFHTEASRSPWIVPART